MCAFHRASVVYSTRSDKMPSVDMDSSEEEEIARKALTKNKMSPADPSASCSLCRAGITDQHLHKLGPLSMATDGLDSITLAKMRKEEMVRQELCHNQDICHYRSANAVLH